MGAREGCYMTNLTDWDYRNVRDFDYSGEYWDKNHKGKFSDPTDYNTNLGNQLRNSLGLDIVTFDREQSQFFKKVYKNFERTRRLIE